MHEELGRGSSGKGRGFKMPIGRAGVARQRKVQKEKTSIQSLGENVREVKLVTMRDQLQRFHESLERSACLFCLLPVG